MSEKKNYRETLEFLCEKYPLVLSKTQAAEILGVSRPTLNEIIKKYNWPIKLNKIPIGTIASYLCG